MNLDSKHRLICDDDNYILQRKRKRANGSKANEWQNVGYWQDLGQALQAYSNGVNVHCGHCPNFPQSDAGLRAESEPCDQKRHNNY